MVHSSPTDDSSAQDLAYWRNLASRSAREASIASRALQSILASQKPASPIVEPIPLPPLNAITPSESIHYNVEEKRRRDGSYIISGWAFLGSSNDCRRNTISGIIRSSACAWAVPLQRVERPDVAAAFPTPNSGSHRASSGFYCEFDAKFLTENSSDLYLVIYDETAGAHTSAAIPLSS